MKCIKRRKKDLTRNIYILKGNYRIREATQSEKNFLNGCKKVNNDDILFIFVPIEWAVVKRALAPTGLKVVIFEVKIHSPTFLLARNCVFALHFCSYKKKDTRNSSLFCGISIDFL